MPNLIIEEDKTQNEAVIKLYCKINLTLMLSNRIYVTLQMDFLI